MGESEIFEVLRASLWTGVLMGLPILGVACSWGFVIGLIQALTSVQEMTLPLCRKLSPWSSSFSQHRIHDARLPRSVQQYDHSDDPGAETAMTDIKTARSF